MPITRRFALGAAAALSLAAGGIAHASPAATVAGHAAKLTISNFAFHPGTLRVARGTTVSVVNRDGVDHTVTARGGAFDLRSLAPGRSGRIRLTRAGTYRYFCRIHSFMHGTIIVR